MVEVVPDANTLIYLAKSGMLDVLNPYKVFVTEEVYDEAVRQGKEEDKSDAYILEKYIEENWTRTKVDQQSLESEVEYFGAAGEASVYLISEKRNATAVTTDKIARNKMKRRSMKVIRTDMLLLRQFEKEKLGKPEFREKLNRLNSVGGTTGQRINFLMQKAEQYERGETKND